MDASDFVGRVDEDLLCVICHNVLLNPYSCKEGHTFCHSCICEWLKKCR